MAWTGQKEGRFWDWKIIKINVIIKINSTVWPEKRGVYIGMNQNVMGAHTIADVFWSTVLKGLSYKIDFENVE